MKTTAAVLYKLNSPLVIEELEIPELQSGQVLVKLLFSGICRAQLNETNGLKGPDKFLPHLLGHEGSGIVEKIGPRVVKVKPGDYVVLSWIKGRGTNAAPIRYQKYKQIINAGPITTFATYAIVSENRLVPIDKRMPPAEAALLGCAIPTGLGIIKNKLNLSRASTIAVFGVGGVGLSVVLGATMFGCRKIIAIDVNKKSLELAKKIGATDTLEFNEETIHTLIKSIAPAGVDYAVEASGQKPAMEAAFNITKDQGTTVIAGNLKYNQTLAIKPFDLIKGKKLVGTWGGETQPDRDTPFYVNKFLQQRLHLDQLISRKFRLEQINQALELMQKGENCGRMLIDYS